MSLDVESALSDLEDAKINALRAKRESALRHQLGENGKLRYTTLTCDVCPQALDCIYAFDCYNTAGDCLAEK